MCGIWSIISKQSISQQYVRDNLHLLDSIKNRGPDNTIVMYDDNIVYGFQRLSIHDITPLGDQPLRFSFKDYENNFHIICTLIVNGEIFNFKEIIEQYGFENDLKSHSDCEVILHLYKKFRDINKILEIIRGEYAFILNIDEICGSEDTNTHTFICRDPYGVRPLFYNTDANKRIFGSTLSSVGRGGRGFTPGTVMSMYNYNYCEQIPYYTFPTIVYGRSERDLFIGVTDHLIKAVKRRTLSDRPIGVTASGGLDSSVVAAIMVKILLIPNLHTFSTGLPNSIDRKYSQIVADHLKTIHRYSPFTAEQGIALIDELIYVLETYDITTIRASIPQYWLAKDIAQNSDIKVILNGDGADEVMMGYKENEYAPNAMAGQDHSIYRTKKIHQYDGLRMDRCISSWGLEARPSFLDQDFVDYVISIDPEFKIPIKGKRMEKQLIRNAFNALYPGLLPDEILYRSKEAFSDGISNENEKSWFEILQEHMESIVSDDEFQNRDQMFIDCPTKEAFYYKRKYHEYFGNNFGVIDGYWLPNWVETNGEPSARVL